MVFKTPHQGFPVSEKRLGCDHFLSVLELRNGGGYFTAGPRASGVSSRPGRSGGLLPRRLHRWRHGGTSRRERVRPPGARSRRSGSQSSSVLRGTRDTNQQCHRARAGALRGGAAGEAPLPKGGCGAQPGRQGDYRLREPPPGPGGTAPPRSHPPPAPPLPLGRRPAGRPQTPAPAARGRGTTPRP